MRTWFKYIILLIFLAVFLITVGNTWGRFCYNFTRGLVAKDCYKYDEAYSWFQKTRLLGNNRVDLNKRLEECAVVNAILAMADNDYSSALNWFQQDTSILSHKSHAYYANALLAAGRYDQAREILSRYEQNLYEHLEILVVWMNMTAQRGDISIIDESYRKASRIHPNNPWIDIYYGDIYWISGFLENAGEKYRTALELQNTHYVALVRLGDWLIKTENDQLQAKKLYLMAINTRSGFFSYDPYYKLSRINKEPEQGGNNPFYRRGASLRHTLNRYTLKWLKNETVTNFRRPFSAASSLRTHSPLDSDTVQ